MPTREASRSAESGFAMILAILALMLLTMLGLTLAVTTSTELQIATNYRWSQQAYYNAEAGLEVAKRHLTEVPFVVVMPAARTQTYDVLAGMGACTAASGGASCPVWAGRVKPGETSRNFENADCDSYAYEGYGVVLDDVTQATPFQNVSQYAGKQLSGTFTIWVRRGTIANPDGTIQDDVAPDQVVVTVEGTAPNTVTNAQQIRGRAIRMIEVKLHRIDPGDCGNRPDQTGGGPSGNGSDSCTPVGT
jgi:hypothetical protein